MTSPSHRGATLLASLSTAITEARRLAAELQEVHDELDDASVDYRVRATRFRFEEAARACRFAADELQDYRATGFPLPALSTPGTPREVSCSPASA